MPRSIEELTQRVMKSQSGFLDIQRTAEEVVNETSPAESLRLAKELLISEHHPVRALATFILGRLSARSPESLALLRQQVSQDGDWRIQEILAKAFDRFCSDRGYEQALPVIRDWLADPSPTVRRAVTEGLRIWTGRPYFRDHPQVAIEFLRCLRGDPSEYVRRSVGNALRDISKKHADLVERELRGWDLAEGGVAQTHLLAGRFLKGRDPGSSRNAGGRLVSASRTAKEKK